MTRNIFWAEIIKTYATFGLICSPLFAFSAYFVATSTTDLAVATAFLLMPFIFWRMMLLRRWACFFVSGLGWLLTIYLASIWKRTDPPFNIVGLVVGLAPTLTLFFGWRLLKNEA